MREHLDQIDWGSVDAAADPAAFSAYLDRLDAAPLVQRYRRLFIDRLPCQPGERILDAGCGAGSDSRLLGELVGPHGRVIGVDFSRHLVRHARSRTIGSVTYAAGDLLHLPVSDGGLDGAICNRVLMHCQDPLSAVEELIRALRPRGWLGVCEPDWSAFRLEPDTAIGRQVLDAHAAAFAQGDIGSRLEPLVRQAGCGEVDAAIQTESTRDFTAMWPLLNLERTLGRLIAGGQLAAAEGRQWQAEVASAAADGAFCIHVLTGYCVARKR